MPWLSIIMALISFFTAKKNGASTGTAAAIAGMAGAATYYVSHETTWGQENLLKYDGGVPAPTVPSTTTKPGPGGTTVNIPTPVSSSTNEGGTGWTELLKDAAPYALGAGAAAALTTKNPWLLPALIVGGVLLLTRA